MSTGAWEATLVTAPTEEPLTLAEAKAHLVISQDDDDALLSAYLSAARAAAESWMERAILTQTWRLQLAAFAETISLPMAAPLQNDAGATPSTAPAVQYYDSAGDLQTLPTTYYLVDTTSTPGCLRRAPNQVWPAVQSDRARPVLVTYVCGWTAPGAVPEVIKQGMRLWLAGAEADRTEAAGAGAAARRGAESLWTLAGRVYGAWA